MDDLATKNVRLPTSLLVMIMFLFVHAEEHKTHLGTFCLAFFPLAFYS